MSRVPQPPVDRRRVLCPLQANLPILQALAHHRLHPERKRSILASSLLAFLPNQRQAMLLFHQHLRLFARLPRQYQTHFGPPAFSPRRRTGAPSQAHHRALSRPALLLLVQATSLSGKLQLIRSDEVVRRNSDSTLSHRRLHPRHHLHHYHKPRRSLIIVRLYGHYLVVY